MYCRTWDELYEDYERAALKRIAKPRNAGALRNLSELEKLNAKVAETLRALRHHEQTHRCHS